MNVKMSNKEWKEFANRIFLFNSFGVICLSMTAAWRLDIPFIFFAMVMIGVNVLGVSGIIYTMRLQ